MGRGINTTGGKSGNHFFRLRFVAMGTVQLRTILSQTLQNVEAMPAFSADIFIDRHYFSFSVDKD